MFKKIVARRESVKLMLSVGGPSGSGKTLSALKLARGIAGDWKRVALADTENRSALYYAGEKTGDWQHIDFPSSIDGGYHPNNWLKLIEYAESDPNITVLVLDSLSHEWSGKGGCLELQSALGGQFKDWARVTPLHNAVLDKIRQSRLHIIATMRSKSEYVIEQNEKGKASPKKVGMASVQREGTEYEFGISFDVEINHHATTSKDRTGLFAGRGPFIITERTGEELLAWAQSGETPAAPAYTSSIADHKIALKTAAAKWEITAQTELRELSAEFDGKVRLDGLDAAIALYLGTNIEQHIASKQKKEQELHA